MIIRSSFNGGSAVKQALVDPLDLVDIGWSWCSSAVVELDPLNAVQRLQLTGIARSLSVVVTMQRAFALSMQDGLERGFFIYSNQRGGYYAGRMVVGLPKRLPKLAESFVPANPKSGRFDLARAYYHVHPGNFPGVGQADVADRNFGRHYGIFVIIHSREGFTIGY